MTNSTEITGSTIQVEIIPQRLLGADSTERILDTLSEMGDVTRIAIQGPRLPYTVPYGPAKGVPVNNPDRREITVGGIVFELKINLGRILLELEDKDAFGMIKETLSEIMPCRFSIKRGKFFKERMTTSDYAKYGVIKDKRVLGLVDPRSNDLYELGSK
jgi:Methyl coenzyme M reductase, subunit D